MRAPLIKEFFFFPELFSPLSLNRINLGMYGSYFVIDGVGFLRQERQQILRSFSRKGHLMMEDKSNVDFIESSSAEVFEIPGEPAIVINGLPPLISRDADTLPCAVTDSQPQKLAVFGEWLEGREVRKLFGDRFFSGEVTQFDKEMGWYRVVYEDGDSEDLEWHELMEVLVPLDVNIPLKTLAIKIIKKRQKSAQKPTRSKVRTRRNGSHDGKGKEKENDAS